MTLVKVIEVDQWTSTGNISNHRFDDIVRSAVRGGDADTAQDLGIASFDRLVVPMESEPPKGKVWFRRGLNGEMELWKTNYDTSD